MLRGSYAYPQCFANEEEFASFIHSEFGERLAGSVYLDHAGAALAAQSQLDEVFQQCRTVALANPHSHSTAGSATAALIERVRAQVLAHFNVDLRSHDLIFTSGATAALQLVAEMFPWRAGGTFCYLNDNHTSVVGIRDVAIKNGAAAVNVVDAQLRTMAKIHHNNNVSLEAPCLFAYPAESNFSGVRYDLDMIQQVQSGALDQQSSPRDRWYVLLDAAKFAATAPLDLSTHRADFVPISFYKLFGYPTGLGALIVRRDTVSRLISDQSAMYFGGGTVEVVDSLSSFHVTRKGFSQRFERGTPNYFAIAALPAGFRILDRLSMSAISAHCAALTKYTVSQMQELRHSNGRQLCQIYGAHLPESQEQSSFVGQGPVIACSLQRAGGAVIGFGEVESLASHACTPPLQFRTGCFCNAGACQSHLDISSDLLRRQHASGRVCGDAHDVIDGRPTGAIRISFGYSSTLADADAWLQFLRTMFLQPANSVLPMSSEPVSVSSTIELSAIYVYPVKSCGAIRASEWSIGDRGLLYDREWAIVDFRGAALNQKRHPHMCFIIPSIEFGSRTLTLQWQPPTSDANTISEVLLRPLRIAMDSISANVTDLSVCNAACAAQGHSYDDSSETATWLTEALGVPCTLVRITADAAGPARVSKGLPNSINAPLSFANEGQYLLISNSSFNAIQKMHAEMIKSDGDVDDDELSLDRFRPNFVVSGPNLAAFSEDSWRNMRFRSGADTVSFVVEGTCTRCIMVNIDQRTAARRSKLFKTLAQHRRDSQADEQTGRITFGILLARSNEIAEHNQVRVGMQLMVDL